MKKVLLTAAIASFSFTAVQAQLSSGQGGWTTANDGKQYDQEDLAVCVQVNDMIMLLPNNGSGYSYNGGNPNGAAITMECWNTPTTFEQWNQTQQMGSPTSWSINATRKYGLWVRSVGNGLVQQTGASPSVSTTISTRRLGVELIPGNVATGSSLGAGTIDPSEQTTNPNTGGLTSSFQQLGTFSDHGAIGAEHQIQMKFFPSVGDNISGKYTGDIRFSAELIN